MEKDRFVWVIFCKYGRDIDLKDPEPYNGPFICHKCLKK